MVMGCWRGPHLCRTCPGTHSGYQFIRAASMSSLEDSIWCLLIFSFLRFLYSFLPFISNVPWALGQGRQRCPIEGWALSGHLFSALWSTTSLCINGCPLQRPRLRVTTIYGYKHKHLEGSLATWSYGKTKLVGYPLGPMDSPVMGFWSCLQYYMQTVHTQPDKSCLTPITVTPLLRLLTHS